MNSPCEAYFKDGCAGHLELSYRASVDARDLNNTSLFLAATLTTTVSSTHMAERGAGEVMPHLFSGEKKKKKNHAVRMS